MCSRRHDKIRLPFLAQIITLERKLLPHYGTDVIRNHERFPLCYSINGKKANMEEPNFSSLFY